MCKEVPPKPAKSSAESVVGGYKHWIWFLQVWNENILASKMLEMQQIVTPRGFLAKYWCAVSATVRIKEAYWMRDIFEFYKYL